MLPPFTLSLSKGEGAFFNDLLKDRAKDVEFLYLAL
jgi:hypothetical protein